MKRRSFLASIGVGIAALVVPSVAARQTGPVSSAYLTDPDDWHLFDKPGGVKTLWVDGSNVFPDGKDGSFERPYLTLRDALDSCGVGSTIYVKSGHVEELRGSLPTKRARIIGLGPNIPRFTWLIPS